MKKILFAALAVFALVSCAKDVETSVQKSAIDFSTSTKYVNRSVVATTDNLANFYVWGYTDRGTTILENQLVTKEASGEWTYSPKKYWPVESKVSFYGIYPTSLEAVTGKPANSLSATVNATSAKVSFAAVPWGMNVAIYANSVPDLIYASAFEKTKDGGKVMMKFRHAMAQVVFKIFNNTTVYDDDSANITVTTSNYVQINEMHYQGDYSLPMTASTSDDTPAQGSWRLAEKTAPWTIATTMGMVINATETTQITDDADANMVIPQSGTVNVVIPCSVKQGNEIIQNHFSFDLDIDWKEGYKYIYTIEINDESLEKNLIEFTADVEPLAEEAFDNITL